MGSGWGVEVLNDALCPYSTPVPGLKVLRGCLLQEKEETGSLKTKTYLAQCTPKGFRDNYMKCADYIRAKENNIEPMELLQRRKRA
jgi:hypothetical protein